MAGILPPNGYRRSMQAVNRSSSKPGGTVYPDISDILACKEERRRENSRRSFGEKIAMMERLRERLAPLKRMREERRQAHTRPAQGDSAVT